MVGEEKEIEEVKELKEDEEDWETGLGESEEEEWKEGNWVEDREVEDKDKNDEMEEVLIYGLQCPCAREPNIREHCKNPLK